MFIAEEGRLIEKTTQTRQVSNHVYSIYWEGVIFYPGFEEGQQSMQQLLNLLDEKDSHLAIMAKVMHFCGSFSLFIRRLYDDIWFVFSDPNHLENVYFTKSAVSNSFLRLRREVRKTETIDDECIASIIYCGANYSQHSYYTAVERLDFTEYLIFSDGIIRKFKKDLGNVYGLNGDQPKYVSTIETIFESLKRHKICLDLTAGTDTRALAICLKYLGFDFETATEGCTNCFEVITAARVAQLLEKKHHSRNVKPEEIQANDLKLAWVACDGQDCSLISYLFERWRKQVGYTLIVGGMYGELHKDGGWFYQCIPHILSGERKINYVESLIKNGRLHWKGLPASQYIQIVTDHYRQVIDQFLRKTQQSLLDKYHKYPLFEMADRIFDEYSTNTPRETGNRVIPRYTPLNERQMMRIGVNQPFFMRINVSFR